MARQKNAEIARIMAEKGCTRQQAYRILAKGSVTSTSVTNAENVTLERVTIAQDVTNETVEDDAIDPNVTSDATIEPSTTADYLDEETGEIQEVSVKPAPPFKAVEPDGRFTSEDGRRIPRGVPVDGMVLVNKVFLTEGTKLIAMEDFMVSEQEFYARLGWECPHFLKGWACKWCLGPEVRHPLVSEPSSASVKQSRDKREAALAKEKGAKVWQGEVWFAKDGKAYPIVRREKADKEDGKPFAIRKERAPFAKRGAKETSDAFNKRWDEYTAEHGYDPSGRKTGWEQSLKIAAKPA